MSIRNYLVLVPSLAFTALVFSAAENTEWKKFKESHDLFILIKNKYKNEDKWVKFSLKDLPDDSHQVNWVVREDFLSKDKKIDVEKITKPEYQCNFYEQKVGGADDKYTMLTIGLTQPQEQVYIFIMEDYYACVTVFAVPNDKAQQTPQAKVKEYAGKLKDLIMSAWHSVAGKKA